MQLDLRRLKVQDLARAQRALEKAFVIFSQDLIMKACGAFETRR
jgi:hypothetical protein